MERDETRRKTKDAKNAKELRAIKHLAPGVFLAHLSIYKASCFLETFASFASRPVHVSGCKKRPRARISPKKVKTTAI
jgi:hypothetical protein